MGIRKYGTSNDSMVAKESEEAREIVSKIMDLGPSQQMILYILHDLSQNLERPENSRRLVSLCTEISDELEKKSTLTQKKELITDF